MTNSTQSDSTEQPAPRAGSAGRLVLDAGNSDYLDLRQSREADPGSVTISRHKAKRYRDALLKTDEELLQDRQELEKSRSELNSIREKLDGLDVQIAQLKQGQIQRKQYLLYGLTALLALGAVGGLAWLIGRRSTVKQAEAVTDSPFAGNGVSESPEKGWQHSESQSAAHYGDWGDDGVTGAGIETGTAYAHETAVDLQEHQNQPPLREQQDAGAEAREGDFGALGWDADSQGLEVTDGNALEQQDEWAASAVAGDAGSGQMVSGQSADIPSVSSDAEFPLPPLSVPEDSNTTGAADTEDVTGTADGWQTAVTGTEKTLTEAAETAAVVAAGSVRASAGQELAESVSDSDSPSATPSVPSASAVQAVAAAEEGDDAVIQDGLTAKEIDRHLSRLSRTDAPVKTASGSRPPAEPVIMAGADMLPADVQQQIRVEQLLRTLSRNAQEAGDAGRGVSASASAEAAPVAAEKPALKPRPSGWKPGQPEGDAIRDGEPGVNFDLSEEKATLTHLPQWKTDRSLAAEQAEKEDASSILMQLDFPAAPAAAEVAGAARAGEAGETENQHAEQTGSAGDVDFDLGESSFVSMEEINEALASDMVPLEADTVGTNTASGSPAAAQAVGERAEETSAAALTVYEEMVELKQPSTAFQYDDFRFEDSAQSRMGRLSGGGSAAGEGLIQTQESASVDTAADDDASEQTVTEAAAFSTPAKPWYRKIFGRGRRQKQRQAEAGVADSGLDSRSSSVWDLPELDGDAADDADAGQDSQQVQERLDAVWKDSNDWMPEDSTAAPAQQVYDDIDLNPSMADMGVLRSRPATGESMLAFLRHLYRQVTALKRAGEVAKARALLLEHLMVMPATSAWVYLEFLSLSDSSGSDTLIVSSKFKERFNRFPPVDRARVTGMAIRPKTLMEYDQALHSLSNVWLQEQARDLMDKWLTGYASNMRLFSLHAYRELFLLYDVLDDVLQVGVRAPAAKESVKLDIDLF